MRTREEINKDLDLALDSVIERPNTVETTMTTITAQHQVVILEVLLDIRDLLSIKVNH